MPSYLPFSYGGGNFSGPQSVPGLDLISPASQTYEPDTRSNTLHHSNNPTTHDAYTNQAQANSTDYAPYYDNSTPNNTTTYAMQHDSPSVPIDSQSYLGNPLFYVAQSTGLESSSSFHGNVPDLSNAEATLNEAEQQPIEQPMEEQLPTYLGPTTIKTDDDLLDALIVSPVFKHLGKMHCLERLRVKLLLKMTVEEQQQARLARQFKNEEPIVCGDCGWKGKYKAALVRHYYSVHLKNIATVLRCFLCGIDMDSQDGFDLTLHLKSHGLDIPVIDKFITHGYFIAKVEPPVKKIPYCHNCYYSSLVPELLANHNCDEQLMLNAHRQSSETVESATFYFDSGYYVCKTCSLYTKYCKIFMQHANRPGACQEQLSRWGHSKGKRLPKFLRDSWHKMVPGGVDPRSGNSAASGNLALAFFRKRSTHAFEGTGEQYGGYL